MNIKKKHGRYVLLIIGITLNVLFFVISFFALLNFMISYKYYVLQNIPYDECVSVSILEQQLKMTMQYCVIALVFSALTLIVEFLLLIPHFNGEHSNANSTSSMSED